MTTAVPAWLAAVGAVPGLAALVGVAVSHGRQVQRLDAVERDVQTVKNLGEQVTRIDERTKNTDKNVSDMKADVSKLTDHLLEEGRTFAPTRAPRRQR